MRINENAKKVMDVIEAAGGEAFVVGGCVRDSIIGRTPKDWDITTSMNPDEVKKAFEGKYKILDTGLQHGTVTVMVGGEGYEVTTYRTDGDYLDGRHPSNVSFTKSIYEDLKRRDLTINAIAYSDERGFVDPFDGIHDIEREIIRTVGSADERFGEDALRMMRAVRFAAQLGFKISCEVEDSILRLNENINLVSKERIHDELKKTIMSDSPDKVELFHEYGLMQHFLPELDVCFDCEQNNPWHIYNVGKHIIEALKNCPKDFEVRMAVLLHDIGKPAAKVTDDEGIDHFPGHADVSAELAKGVLTRLKFTSIETANITKLVALHDVKIELEEKYVKRFINRNDAADLFEKYIAVRRADNKAQNLELSTSQLEVTNLLMDMYEKVISEKAPFGRKDLEVTGVDMIGLGYKGKEIGEILEILLDAVIDDPSKNDWRTLMGIACDYKGIKFPYKEKE